MFCTQCGKKTADDSRFCQDCGAPLSGRLGGSTSTSLGGTSPKVDGPLEERANALVEAAHVLAIMLLPDDVQRLLVDRGCLRVGMFLGALAFVVAFRTFAVRWWLAGIFSWFVLLISGALLKLAFKTV